MKPTPTSQAPRSSRISGNGGGGTDFAHDVLLALTMAFALALLGTTTWLWCLR